MDGRTVGLLVGAVGGTAFVVFNAPRLPTAVGVPLAVLAVAALVGLGSTGLPLEQIVQTRLLLPEGGPDIGLGGGCSR